MKENKFTGKYITCPTYKKTYELTAGSEVCPICGGIHAKKVRERKTKK